jgi:hypothetical protein
MKTVNAELEVNYKKLEELLDKYSSTEDKNISLYGIYLKCFKILNIENEFDPMQTRLVKTQKYYELRKIKNSIIECIEHILSSKDYLKEDIYDITIYIDTMLTNDIEKLFI